MTIPGSPSARRIGLIVGGLWIVAFLSELGATGATSTRSSQTLSAAKIKASEPLNGGAEYVGEAVCIACHTTQNNQFSHTLHANVFRLNPRNELQQRTCEACHGPGSNHIKDPANPKNHGALVAFTREWGTPIPVQNSMCLTCHKGGNAMFWSNSPHGRNQLSCSDCHNPMAKISDSGLLKKTSINETCYTCHKQQRAEFAKRSHMPLPEGKMSCVDCHNPHGSTSKAMLKGDSVNETCYACHAEKRGPFLWEHAPVRESCLNCHNPHGANQDKLLQVARPFLCQQCHGNTNHQSNLYNAGQLVGGGAAANARMLGRSCQNCHSQIHGSNDPSGARFQR
ncbi:MAG TPA: DmsE family decaheme c-type cytochrome [Lacunisphaera sp.]|jgi:DmsE family decaheme c-type cytochrome